MPGQTPVLWMLGTRPCPGQKMSDSALCLTCCWAPESGYCQELHLSFLSDALHPRLVLMSPGSQAWGYLQGIPADIDLPGTEEEGMLGRGVVPTSSRLDTLSSRPQAAG